MSKYHAWSLAVAFGVACAFAHSLPAADTASPDNAKPAVADAADSTARLDTFVKSDGAGYFALSVLPAVEVAEPAGSDIVILFDTSASQAGLFRDKGLAVIVALLKSLPVDDRAAIRRRPGRGADDQGICGAAQRSDAPAVEQLKLRAPLGSSDMPDAFAAALRAAGWPGWQDVDRSGQGRDLHRRWHERRQHVGYG